MNKLHTYREDELIALLKQEDAQAFDYLYDHYAPALNGIILSFVPEQQQALDVLQECFVKIWHQIGTYNASKGKLFTWLSAIARNTAIDMLRSKGWKNSLQNKSLSNQEHVLASGTEPNVDLIGIKGFVKNLRDEYRQVVELAYFEGLRHQAISEETGLPVGTVKTRLRSALIELRKNIN